MKILPGKFLNRVDGEASVSNPQPKLKSFQFQKSEDRTEVPQLFWVSDHNNCLLSHFRRQFESCSISHIYPVEGVSCRLYEKFKKQKVWIENVSVCVIQYTMVSLLFENCHKKFNSMTNLLALSQGNHFFSGKANSYWTKENQRSHWSSISVL